MLILLAAMRVGMSQVWIQWRSDQGGNNHYYALTLWPTNWAAAQALAVSWGGTLATITSSNEQDFISRTILTGRFEHLPVWLGLVRTRTNVTFGLRIERALADLGVTHSTPDVGFKWITAERSSYDNWHSGQPDDFPPGENYVAMNWHYSDMPPRGTKGDWNDVPLNGTRGFGGATDGPYFGLVEREPTGHLRLAGSWLYLSLVTILLVGLLIALAALRRMSEKSNAETLKRYKREYGPLTAGFRPRLRSHFARN
jgi:hypothetical protein